MRVLIVEENKELGELWQGHIRRAGCDVVLAHDEETATVLLRENEFSVIVLDSQPDSGSALAIADYAGFRQPGSQVIFVTHRTFFSDGSVFQHIPNVRAVVQRETPPGDLTEMVRHYATGA